LQRCARLLRRSLFEQRPWAPLSSIYAMKAYGQAPDNHSPGSSRVLSVLTSRHTELKDITAEVQRIVQESGCASGVCCLYVPHTTAGVTINEGDDPAVARDIEAAFDRAVPRDALYKHLEGNADSHVKTALTGVSAIVFIEHGRLALGRWQAIFFCEFDGPRSREVRVKIIPDRLA
jgi:secondary thiamine-phosphate synthase enzyme